MVQVQEGHSLWAEYILEKCCSPLHLSKSAQLGIITLFAGYGWLKWGASLKLVIGWLVWERFQHGKISGLKINHLGIILHPLFAFYP